jgi:hypothetical protein
MNLCFKISQYDVVCSETEFFDIWRKIKLLTFSAHTSKFIAGLRAG